MICVPIVAAMCETESKLLNVAPDGENRLRKSLYESLGDMASELKAFTTALTYYTLMLEVILSYYLLFTNFNVPIHGFSRKLLGS